MLVRLREFYGALPERRIDIARLQTRVSRRLSVSANQVSIRGVSVDLNFLPRRPWIFRGKQRQIVRNYVYVKKYLQAWTGLKVTRLVVALAGRSKDRDRACAYIRTGLHRGGRSYSVGGRRILTRRRRARG